MGSILSIDDRLRIIGKWNPKKAEELRLAYLLEDEDEGRRDVRWHIDNMAEMVLLDSKYKDSVFLSAPPEVPTLKGDVQLGVVMKGRTALRPHRIEKQELLKHIGVFGSTGCGKTNAIYSIINSMARNGIPMLIFDFSKRNYRDLLETELGSKIRVFTIGKNTAPFRFNPLAPPDRVLPSVWARRFSEIFDHSFWLLGGGRYILLKAMEDLYNRCGVYSNSGKYPTLSEVRNWVAEYESRKMSFREKNWVSTAKRALESLCSKETGDMFVKSGIKPNELLSGITVLELDGLNEDNRVFFIEIILQWLRDWLLDNWKKEELAGVIILEEAHHVLNREKSRKIGSETVMDLLFREVRELGMGIIYADQHPSKVSYSALGNTNMQIYMRLQLDSRYDSDILDGSKMLGLKNDEIDYLRNLDVGYGIVRSPASHEPFLVKFPDMEVKKGRVTDEKLKRAMKDNPGMFYADKTVFYGDKISGGNVELGELDLRIIRALGNGEAISTKQLVYSLKTSGKILNERMGVLINNKYVRYRKAKLYNNRVCYYYLAEKGATLFRNLTGKEEVKPEIPETLHRQMKDFVIGKYTGLEGNCTLGDNNVGTGYVDVLLEKGGKTVKIEIETGANSNDWLYRNVDKCVKVEGTTYFLCASQKVKNRVIQQATKYSLENNRNFRIFVLTFKQLKELKQGGPWDEIRFGENPGTG